MVIVQRNSHHQQQPNVDRHNSQRLRLPSASKLKPSSKVVMDDNITTVTATDTEMGGEETTTQKVVLGDGGNNTILKLDKSTATAIAKSTNSTNSTTNSNAVNNNNNNNNMSKTVKFGFVHVRYYERILCDHPSVQSGPAIGLGWKFYTREKEQQQQQSDDDGDGRSNGGNNAFDIKEYERLQCIKKERKAREQEELLSQQHESTRSSRSRSSSGRHTPRSNRLLGRQHYEQSFLLSRFERECILKDWGYQPMEVAKMIRKIIKVKHQRRQTFNNLGRFEIMEEYIEMIQRRISKCMYCLITLNQKSNEEIMYQTYKKNIRKKQKQNSNRSNNGNSNSGGTTFEQ